MRISTEADLDSIARCAKLVAVVAAWDELGLWQRLAERDEPVELTELPGDRRALHITAVVLANAGLLDGDGRAWKLSSTGRRLQESRGLSIGGNLEWLGDLSRMAEVIRDGGPVRGADGVSKATNGGVLPDDVEQSRMFLDRLYRRSEEAAVQSASWIARRVTAGARALDLGGGHGRYAFELARRGMRATLFDRRVAIDLAEERCGDAITYLCGDYHQDPLGGPYDVVLMSNVVHGEPYEGNAALIQRVARALHPGGWLVVKDMFIDDQHRGPEEAAFFGTTMLFYTEAGQSYDLQDVDEWCRAAGLEKIEVVAVATQTLVLAQKPV